MSTTFEKVKELVIKNLGVPAEKVVESANFVNDLGADSLDVVEFVMEVEKVFDVEIPDDAAGQLVT
ncbi:MAG: acyl carrier protein, partial [Alphaproteobacteria bacterium]|nr:acyl carrier protein [Alphaproteobacteria bacterium]